MEQIIQLLAENDVSDAAALEESAKNHVFDKFDFVDNENLAASAAWRDTCSRIPTSSM